MYILNVLENSFHHQMWEKLWASFPNYLINKILVNNINIIFLFEYEAILLPKYRGKYMGKEC